MSGIFSHRISTGTCSICASLPSPSTACANERAVASIHLVCASKFAAPAESPLPWDDRPGRANRDSVGDFALDAAAVDRFDQLLHEIHPQARHVDADRIASLGRWLQDLPVAEARAVLDERLSRIERLRAMLDDADLDRREAVCDRVRRLLAYLDQDHDLIPDAIPLLGKLDDVILL